MWIKRIIISGLIVVLLCFAAGCGIASNPTDASNSPAVNTASSPSPSQQLLNSPDDGRQSISQRGLMPKTEEDQKTELNDFEQLLKAVGKEKEAIADIKQEAPHMSAGNATKMVLDFEAYQNNGKAAVVTKDLMNLIQSGFAKPYNENMLNAVSNIQNSELKNAMQNVLDRGYKIIIPEGMTEAVINYDVYKQFENFATPDIKAYIEIMASESESRMLEDGGIIIPIDEVYARARACESFIALYPASSKIGQVKSMCKTYIDAYFFGMDNTPAFDMTKKKLNQNFMDSYQNASTDGSKSRLSKDTSDYMQILKNNGYMLTDAVKKYRQNMMNELLKN